MSAAAARLCASSSSMATKKAKKPTEDYTAYITIAGKSFQASGATALDAIAALNPDITKGRGILTLSHSGRRRERLLMPAHVFRLFNTHGIVRDILVKNIALLFADV